MSTGELVDYKKTKEYRELRDRQFMIARPGAEWYDLCRLLKARAEESNVYCEIERLVNHVRAIEAQLLPRENGGA